MVSFLTATLQRATDNAVLANCIGLIHWGSAFFLK